jgi:hypothetical protein
VYTTNHKRIAVNYFNFVLVAGTAGMSLATVIRLEFAYPGVGILAGDSLQYLSIATAHGVIMVFFMIMPAIFGAFGNFLLPTQLGVHDVAFPRLNSAAFWFLPGGLIMLCQLVCTDRRYARMNCFNIRELQGILKRKFFTDLVNNHEHHSLMDKTMIGLRYKSNNNINLDNDMLSFYNFGITTQASNHSTFLKSSTSDIAGTRPFMGNFNLHVFNLVNGNDISLFFRIYSSLSGLLLDISSLLFSINLFSFLSTFKTQVFFKGFLNNFSFLNLNLPQLYPIYNISNEVNSSNILFSGKDTGSSLNLNELKNSFSESSSSQRFSRFSSPLINYDYKTGHYIGN